MAQPFAQAHGLASQPVNMTDMLLGIPAFTASHAGVDRMGVECRLDPSVSVMRFGQRADVLCLADGVSLYAQTRLVLGDVVADPCVGIRIGARTIVNVGGYLSGEGGLEIGEDVLIGPHAKLLSAGHAIDEERFGPAHHCPRRRWSVLARQHCRTSRHRPIAPTSRQGHPDPQAAPVLSF